MSEIDVINSRKQDIACCITKSIVDNSNLEFESVFKLVNESVNNANVVVPLLKAFESTYDVKLNELIKEVSELVFFDVSLFITNKEKIVSPVRLKREYDEQILSMYVRNINMYKRVGITFDNFVKLYSFYKADGIKKVNSKIKTLVKVASVSELKRDCSFLIDAMKFKKNIKYFDVFLEQFNVKSIEEFLEFRNEVLSFTLNEKEYSEGYNFVLENRESFKKRCGKTISAQEAKKLLKKIDEIFDLGAFKAVFSDECWKSMIEKIGLTSKNIGELTSSYVTLMSSSGMCSKYLDKNGDVVVYCIFPKKIFSLSSKTINNIILHEFIHSIDRHNPNYTKSFSQKYCSINEAITEYFSHKACKNLNASLFDGYNKAKSVSIYDSMLPLVEILKHSEIWDDILNAKLNNDVVELEKKIGVPNMRKIRDCFVENLKERKNLKSYELKKILFGIEKDLNRTSLN